jgi:hypothetical protein
VVSSVGVGVLVEDLIQMVHIIMVVVEVVLVEIFD